MCSSKTSIYIKYIYIGKKGMKAGDTTIRIRLCDSNGHLRLTILAWEMIDLPLILEKLGAI